MPLDKAFRILSRGLLLLVALIVAPFAIGQMTLIRNMADDDSVTARIKILFGRYDVVSGPDESGVRVETGGIPGLIAPSTVEVYTHDTSPDAPPRDVPATPGATRPPDPVTAELRERVAALEKQLAEQSAVDSEPPSTSSVTIWPSPERPLADGAQPSLPGRRSSRGRASTRRGRASHPSAARPSRMSEEVFERTRRRLADRQRRRGVDVCIRTDGTRC